MKVAVEQIFDGSIQQVAIGGSYDATKINRGKHTGQYNLGSSQIDKFIGPTPLGVANFGEAPQAILSPFVHPIKISDDLYWIFGADGAAASLTRRVQLWTWVPSTNFYNFIGAITCTFPPTGNSVTRGLRAVYDTYTAGTVSVSGTAVTGSGTAWLTGLSVGSRIGFGSTNPLNITTWYQISAIGSDTSITLTLGAGTISAGTSYVIEDLMIVQANTNATATNGGLFVTKGLRYEDFQSPATSIPAATTVDKIKANYWLKDAATITNDVIGGCALGDKDSWTQQYVYSTEGNATSLNIYRYNIRAPLTLTSGAMVLSGSDMVVTGTQTVTGNISQVNNGRVATLSHGQGVGIPSLFVFTLSRILRIPLSEIVSGSTTYIADQMNEVVPGSSFTNVAGSGFISFDVATSIDKLVIATSTGSNGAVYITDYYTGGQQIDRRASCNAGQLPSSFRDLESPIFVHYVSTSNNPTVWVEDGWLFWCYSTTTTLQTSAMTVYPLAADLIYQSDVNNRIILPKIDLGGNQTEINRVYVNCVQNIGDDTMGVTPDMYKLQVRTSGIDDNSGQWVDVPQTGDLSGIGTPSNIQFAFLFRTAGLVMLPARILSLGLVYEIQENLPSQYRWNYNDFNLSGGTFAWIQSSLFGTSIGTHTIEIYRSDTDQLVLTQSSTSTTNGTFEYWNGSTWVAGLGTDVVGTRRRFVPSGSLPGSVELYAKILIV